MGQFFDLFSGYSCSLPHLFFTHSAISLPPLHDLIFHRLGPLIPHFRHVQFCSYNLISSGTYGCGQRPISPYRHFSKFDRPLPRSDGGIFFNLSTICYPRRALLFGQKFLTPGLAKLAPFATLIVTPFASIAPAKFTAATTHFATLRLLDSRVREVAKVAKKQDNK